MESEKKKKVIKKYLFIAFLLIAISVSILLMVKYNVEGEKNLPIELNEIVIRSTIYAQSNNAENILESSVEQDNDIFITFENNDKVDSKVDSIRIENMKIEKKNELGTIKVLKPTSNEKLNYFQNSSEDYSGKALEYFANTFDNLERQEFAQDNGTIAFRISNQNLGTYVLTEDGVRYNENLLEQLGTSSEEIKLDVTFDVVLVVSDSEKYKGTVKIELPADSFGENGIVTKSITDFGDVVFKRVERK